LVSAGPNIPEVQDVRIDVDRVVEAAAEELKCGQVGHAKRLLAIALAIVPENRKAQYYSSLVEECIYLPSKTAVRPWYPTLPPRPVQQ